MNVNSNLANTAEHCKILFTQKLNIKYNKYAYELYKL